MAVEDQQPHGHDDDSIARHVMFKGCSPEDTRTAAAGVAAHAPGVAGTPDNSAEHGWRSAVHYSSSSGGSSSGAAAGRAASPSAGDDEPCAAGNASSGAGRARGGGGNASSSQPQNSEASCGYDAEDADDFAEAHLAGFSADDEEEELDEDEQDEDDYLGCVAGAASAVDDAFHAAPLRRWCTNCASGIVLIEHPDLPCSKCGHRAADDDALFTSHDAADAHAGHDTAAAGAAGAHEDPSGLLLCWDDAMLLHEEEDDCPHPERPDRLRAVMARLTRRGLAARCRRVPSRPATEEEILRCHTREHLQRLRDAADWPAGALQAVRWLPADTYVNEHTFDAALLAAGSAAEAAVAVARGQARAAAAIIRPPGHHAESNTAMGFCFFNNAAIAARAARAAGAERVLILDWDVHHGNGTQHIFEESPDVLYMSLHRWDRGSFYPGTGAPTEVGWGAGRGFSVNVAWDGPGATDGDYALAMRRVLLPIARAFAPSLVIISAGFDAAEGDPIGGCHLTPAAFAAMTAQLAAVAPTALLLEGGYNLSATATSTEACVRVLMGEAPLGDVSSDVTGDVKRRVTLAGWRGVQAALQVQARFWDCLAPLLSEAPPPHVLAAMQQQAEAERRRREAQQQAMAAAAAAAQQQQQGVLAPPAAPQKQQQYQHQQQQQRSGGSREHSSGGGSEDRPWSARHRRPSASTVNEARLHMMRMAGLSRKQQLLRHLHRRALRMALKRRCAAAQRRREQAAAAAAVAAAEATAAAAEAGTHVVAEMELV